VNGDAVEFEANAVGSIDLEVPAGESRVTLVCRAPPLRRAMLLFSAVGLVVWLVILVRPPTWLGFRNLPSGGGVSAGAAGGSEAGSRVRSRAQWHR
jgi:hypothetical protein